MAESYLIDVPRDVEADLVIGLDTFGIEASTFVSADRDVGAIRVSRTGGSMSQEGQRDSPQVLVEVWGANSADAWDRAIEVWAAFAVFNARGWIVQDVASSAFDVDPPRALDDELAPNLYRVQFLATFIHELTQLELTEETQ